MDGYGVRGEIAVTGGDGWDVRGRGEEDSATGGGGQGEAVGVHDAADPIEDIGSLEQSPAKRRRRRGAPRKGASEEPKQEQEQEQQQPNQPTNQHLNTTLNVSLFTFQIPLLFRFR